MTPERFRFLTEAYSADLSRWPDNYRSEVAELSSKHFTELRQIMVDAAMLDQLLACYVVAPADPALFNRIMASAPKQQGFLERLFTFKWPHWPSNDTGNTGFNSAKFAGIGLASVIAGAFCVSIFMSSMLSKHTDMANSNITNSKTEYIDYGQDWTAS